MISVNLTFMSLVLSLRDKIQSWVLKNYSPKHLNAIFLGVLFLVFFLALVSIYYSWQQYEKELDQFFKEEERIFTIIPEAFNLLQQGTVKALESGFVAEISVKQHDGEEPKTTDILIKYISPDKYYRKSDSGELYIIGDKEYKLVKNKWVVSDYTGNIAFLASARLMVVGTDISWGEISNEEVIFNGEEYQVVNFSLQGGVFTGKIWVRKSDSLITHAKTKAVVRLTKTIFEQDFYFFYDKTIVIEPPL